MRKPTSTETSNRQRWLAMTLAVVALGAAIGSGSGATTQRPFWTEQAMFRFGDELYFVGVASCAMSAEQGRQKAFEAGMKELGGYAQERETSRLLVDTAMIYEEFNAPTCPKGTTSVWRLLRVDQARIQALPRGDARAGAGSSGASEKPLVQPQVASVQDLAPKVGMSREDIAQRFGKPKTMRKEGQDEIWEYADTGLTITFSGNETLVSSHLVGKPDRTERVAHSGPSAGTEPPVVTAKPAAPAIEPERPIVLPPPIPLSKDPVVEGRALFNGKGGCNLCHGRDADMYTDVKPDTSTAVTPGVVMPGYFPPTIGVFSGPSPRRLAPNLRKWSALSIRTDLDLARAIKDGIAGSIMTGTRHLSDEEVSYLVAYLNSLH